MMHEIGESAGKVWRHLHKHGEMSVSALGKGSGLSAKLLERSIGWLAREDKVKLRKDGRVELISLK